jgi:hypothetical protein
METPLKTDKDGSTLIITLLVVGLMLIAVLAMATHVRLEMRAVQSRYFQALANKCGIGFGFGRFAFAGNSRTGPAGNRHSGFAG